MKCERCKGVMPIGSHGIRHHGRIWHPDCVYAHIKERQQVRGPKRAPLPKRMRARS